MDPNRSNSESDPLTGSPELFATNLLIARGIENGLESIEIENKNGTVVVQLHSSNDDLDSETLTEDPQAWAKIVDRFREMTEFDESSNSKGTLQPKTPMKSEIENIRIDFQQQNRIELSFHYPD